MPAFTRLRLFAAILTSSLAVAGCGTSKTASGSLAIDPADVTIAVGQTQAFTVQLVLSGKKTDVTSQATWTSMDMSVATIDSTGVATGVANGMTTIVGSRQGLTVSAKLTVSDATLVSIEVSPNKPTIAAGTTEQFTATGTFSDATTRDVSHANGISWKSASTDVATINGSGLASAVKSGSSDISATIGSVSGSTSLTVSDATLTGVVIEPAANSIAKGTTKQLTATATFSDKSTQDVTASATWSSSAADVATVSDDDGSKGLVTGKVKGDATISAMFMGMNGTAGVAVSDASLTSIAIDPAMATVAKGIDQVFAAIGTFSDGTTQDISSTVVWTVSDAGLAAVSNATGSKGRVSTIATGDVKVTAKSGALSGDAKLTITGAQLKSIAISGPSSIAKGTHTNFTATATYSDNSTGDITDNVTWQSSDPSVASVSNADGSHGQVTGEGTGGAMLTAQVEGISASANVTVTPATLVSIAVSPGTQTIAQGTTWPFVAMGTYSDGVTQDITSEVSWTSDDGTLATISNTAGTRGVATGVSPGDAHITAMVGAITSGPATLTVSAATLVSIAIDPSTKAFAKGTTFAFTATGTFTDDTTQNLTTQVTWSSDDSNVATISNTAPNQGRAARVNGGTTTLRALFNSVSGTATVTITGAALQSIAVTPASPTIPNGGKQQFTATGTYTDNSIQDLTSSVTWTSSTTSVLTISNAAGTRGQATAVATGMSSVTAAYQGVTSTPAPVTVNDAVLVSIAIDPSSLSLPKGLTSPLSATGTYSDSTTVDLTSAVTWATGDSGKATITNGVGGGVVTAVDIGSTSVTATMGSVVGTMSFVVSNAVINSLSIAPSDPTVIAAGATQPYTAQGRYTDNSVVDLTSTVVWASSNSGVSISNAGATKGHATSSVQNVTTITASTGGLTSNAASLTFTNAQLVSIAVTPASPSIPKGATQLFTATGTYTDSSTLDLTSSVTWSSSDTTIATLSNVVIGRARGRGVGVATITATYTPTGSSTPFTGSTNLTVTNANLVSIDVTPANSTIAHFTHQHFKAQGTYTDSTTQDLTSAVTWSTSNPAIATVSNASANPGLGSALTPGSVTVTAVLGSITGSTPFTVSNATLTSIDVTPPGTTTIPLGLTQSYGATGHFDDHSTQDLTQEVSWSTDAPGVATISNALGSEGLATTAGTPGTATISAALLGQVGTASLVVTSAVPTSVQINALAAAVAAGVQGSFTASALYTDGITRGVTATATWATDNTNVTDICIPGSNPCLVNTFIAGTATISATVTGLSGPITATKLFTVNPADLVSIDVTPAAGSLPKGLHQQFVARGTYTDHSQGFLTTQVTWSTSDATKVAISNTTGSEGFASALDIATGVTIEADFNTPSGTITGTTTLDVTSAVLSELQLTAASSSLAKGLTQQYTATGVFSDNTSQNLTTSVSWDTDNHSVATVSGTIGSKGLLTANDVGTANVTADYLGVHGSVAVSVTAALLQTITVGSTDIQIGKGGTEQYTAIGTYSDNSTQNLTTTATWSSSSEAAATIVFNTGLATGVDVGNTTISATYNGVTGSKGLTVTPAVLTSITVGSAQSSIPKGTQLQFSATGHYSDSSTQDLTTTVTWASSSGGVASIVTGTGLATANSVGGPVDITATDVASGIHDTKPLTVGAAIVTSLDVTPTAPSVAVGTKRQFTAIAHFSDSTATNVTTSAGCTWTSSATNVATISNSLVPLSRGLATAIAGGTTTIQANFNGFSTSATLTVTQASLASISITPSNASIPRGFDVVFHATGTYTDATTQDLTNQVTWISSDPTIATISNALGTAGTLSASATNFGPITVTASFGTRTGTTPFTVTNATLVSTTIDPANGDIATCDCSALTVTGTFSDASQYDITSNSSLGLASSADDTVRVYQSGLVWLACSGSNAGGATVTATHAGDLITTSTTETNDGACN